MPREHPNHRRKFWRQWLLPGILLVGVAAGAVWVWRSGLFLQLTNKERLVAMLREDGWRGPLLCVAVQFIQVVIFVIPGEITQFASGYVFGAWYGLVYSIVGIMLGSAFNFYFARVVGRPVLERLVGLATLARVDTLLNNARGKSAVFLLFLIPGTPKDALCYGAGLSEMNLLEFVVISGIGRFPALLSSIVLGSQLSHRNYRAMAITALAVVLAIGTYYLYERQRSRRAAEKNRV